jgi:aryl-alcohol dehydrogenase-like predicted oxidoreductase
MERRHFLVGLATAGLVSSIGEAEQQPKESPSDADHSGSSARIPRTASAGTMKGEMLYRTLGRTGEQVSAVGLGGSHIAKPGLDEATSIRLIHEALDRGLNFMDNSWDYNQGQSEARMGKALAQKGYRQKAFLMTKIDGRTKESAASQIEMSLQRLRTDHIDLLQHHEVLRFEDPDRIFAESGAMEACIEAKKAGKIRYIGFTGHKDPRVHLYMLRTAARHGFQFDTAQMPLNLMDAHFRSFAQEVVPVCVSQQVGVLGMKPLGGGDGIILKSDAATATECLRYALTLPTSVVITGIDSQETLNQAFEAARTFQIMNEQQLATLLAKTREVATAGQYELYKTSAHFDTTARHPDWLGGETPGVQKLVPQPSA